jgi:methionyl-tRNA formyltransferase
MKILCVGYRDWAIKIYKNLIIKKKNKIFLHYTKSHLEKKISKISPDVILFYGWSWKIKEKIFKNYRCFMLHPSPLPKYRGGSPLNWQLINCENEFGISVIKINHKVIHPYFNCHNQ